MPETIELLLDAAENAMRLRGYHAVSFRDLADELGVKSSSVHYYFRQKEDLGLALVERYSQRFFEALETESAKASSARDCVAALCSVYRRALLGSDRICLCGMLGAESSGLPPALAEAVAEFFEANISWLVNALADELPPQKRRIRATHIVTALQGAMLVSSSLEKRAVFDDTVKDLLST